MSAANRFEIILPAAQRQALTGLAQEAGVSSSGLARLAISHLLARAGLVLTGTSPAGPGGDLDAFVAELRADPRLSVVADQMAEALRAVDAEGDGNPDAICLLAAVAAICRGHGSIETRLRLLSRLIEHDWVISMPRALLNPNQTTGSIQT